MTKKTRQLRPSEIIFGKVDAKSEFLQRNKELKDAFFNSFTIPPDAILKEILIGDRYIFHGAKGSGKTSLLRYVDQLEKNQHNPTRFIVFQDDVSEESREIIVTGINEERPTLDDETNVSDMWRLYLLKQIRLLLDCGNSGVQEDSNFINFSNIIDNFFELNDIGTLSRIRKAIQSGYLKINANIATMLKIEGQINLTETTNSIPIRYINLIEKLESILTKIDFPIDVKSSLFVDELNLSLLTHKQHKRDSILIRDLILSISKINIMFIEKNLPINIYCAIRTEILSSRGIARNEINKAIKDHGQKLNWCKGKNPANFPIMELIENKIKASEKRLSLTESTSDDIWRKYFSHNIFGVGPRQFISEITWCNPRDVVTLFNVAGSKPNSRNLFDHSLFVESMEEYSSEVWQEKYEELSVDYSATELDIIKNFLTRYYRNFKEEVFAKSLTTTADSNAKIKQLLAGKSPTKICADLYYAGVLGMSRPAYNKKDKIAERSKDFSVYWYYREQEVYDNKNWLVIHNALRPALKISLNATDFGTDSRYDSKELTFS